MSRERESSLGVQLDGEIAKSNHLENLNEKMEKEVEGLEEELGKVKGQLEKLRAAQEDQSKARGVEVMLREEVEEKGREVMRLQSSLEEVKAHNTKLMQENLVAVAKAEKAVREVSGGSSSSSSSSSSSK